MYAVISFVLSILIFIPAVLIFIASIFNIPEAHPFSVVAYPIILVLSLPEAPLHAVSQSIGFPVILPSISIVLAVVSLLRKELRRLLAVVSVALTAVSISLYLVIRLFLE